MERSPKETSATQPEELLTQQTDTDSCLNDNNNDERLSIGNIFLSSRTLRSVSSSAAPPLHRDDNSKDRKELHKVDSASQIKVLYMNGRSIKSVNSRRNKLVLFQNLVESNQPSLVAVTETWLTPSIKDDELLPKRYLLYRKDRCTVIPGKIGGGILLAVNGNILSRRRSDIEPVDEILVCEMLTEKQGKIGIILFYRPPNGDLLAFTNNLQYTLRLADQEYNKVVLLGDLNLPNIDWCSLIGNSTTENQFCDVLNDFSLTQVNNVTSNSHNHLLDVILTNVPEKCSKVEKVSSDFPTDHTILQFDLNFRTVFRQSNMKRHVYQYKKCNFDNLRQSLRDTLGSQGFVESDSIDDCWDTWLQCLCGLVENHVPKAKIKNSYSMPWCDGDVYHLRNKKLTAWRRAKKTNRPAHWHKFRKLRNGLQKLIHYKYKLFLENLGSLVNNNPKKFWTFFKNKTKSHCLPQILKYKHYQGTTPTDKANLFNKFFFSVFTTPVVNQPLPEISAWRHPFLGNIDFTIKEVLDVLLTLDCTKAIGPDSISPVILREGAHVLAPQLTAIFNKSIQSGIVPAKWKEANVCPVFKKGSKDSVENYRPISLLSVVSKVMERCIFNRIFPHLQDQIHPLQHGFIKGKSTTTQLLETFQTVGTTLDHSGQIDIIYLDFSKAFDSIPHHLLVHKLKTFGFHSNLLNWFSDYLSNRRQRVVIEGVSSDWLPVISGVPQGSILGPLLFLLYINDLPSTIECPMALYADDSKCYKQISSPADCISLQHDIDNMVEWSVTWMMKFNTSKCNVLTICRSKTPVLYDYEIEGQVLSSVTEFNDLGVTMSNCLSFKSHIKNITASANSTLGFIKRSVGYHAPANVKKILYITLVRPKLEYCSLIWSPHTHNLITSLEKVQRRATKYILNNHTTDYRDRLIYCQLLPLSYRRELLDLSFLFKCFLGQYGIDIHQYISFPLTSLRSNSQAKLQPQKCLTTTFKNYFFQRIVHIWNALPLNIRTLKLSPVVTINTFKKAILVHYLSLTNDRFNSNDVCTWVTHCQCPSCTPF